MTHLAKYLTKQSHKRDPDIKEKKEPKPLSDVPKGGAFYYKDEMYIVNTFSPISLVTGEVLTITENTEVQYLPNAAFVDDYKKFHK